MLSKRSVINILLIFIIFIFFNGCREEEKIFKDQEDPQVYIIYPRADIPKIINQGTIDRQIFDKLISEEEKETVLNYYVKEYELKEGLSDEEKTLLKRLFNDTGFSDPNNPYPKTKEGFPILIKQNKIENELLNKIDSQEDKEKIKELYSFKEFYGLKQELSESDNEELQKILDKCGYGVVSRANELMVGTFYDDLKVNSLKVAIESDKYKHAPHPAKVRSKKGRIVKWKLRLINIVNGNYKLIASAKDAAKDDDGNPAPKVGKATSQYQVKMDKNEYYWMRGYLPYLYQYGVGSIFFIIGMIMIVKSKSYRRDVPTDKWGFIVLFIGILYFITFHGLWTLFALNL